MDLGARVVVVMFAAACGGSKEPAAPPATSVQTAPATGTTPPAMALPAELPSGPWLTVTDAGSLRVQHPARWTCSSTHPTGRVFTVGTRTECLLPIEFLTYQVFGCPDTITHGSEVERATYDDRGRLLTYGTRPDYQTTYTWNGDVPATRNGTKITVTRDGSEVRWDEDGIVMTYVLDAQQRPIGSRGMLEQKLTWVGDDLTVVDWHMTGLDDIRTEYVSCRAAKSAAASPRP